MADVYNSKLAKFFAFFNGAKRFAVTFGQTAYYTVSKESVETAPGWIVHENVHKEQYKRYGNFGFLVRYIFYMIRFWKPNPIEVEARKARTEFEALNNL